MPNNFLPMDPQQGGGGIAGLFSDPNFLSFLAGTGKGLDPEGVGGALGGATQGWIQAEQTSKALEKKDAQTERLIEAMAGGQIGGATVKPDGTMTLKAPERGALTQGELGDKMQSSYDDWAKNLQTQAQTDPTVTPKVDLMRNMMKLMQSLGFNQDLLKGLGGQ